MTETMMDNHFMMVLSVESIILQKLKHQQNKQSHQQSAILYDTKNCGHYT